MRLSTFVLFIVFLFPITKTHSQILDISSCEGDTVYLKLNGYHGQVQWQSSADSLLWEDIVNTSDTLTITTSPDLIYRAIVKDGTCDSVVSDTTLVRFFPIPTTAFAGTDQLNLNAISTTLAANSLSVGTGTWQIISGTGGNIASVNMHNSVFTGVGASSYTLVWTVSNECKTTKDTVVISFAMPQVNCNGTMYVHPVDNHGGAVWGCQGTVTNATSLTNGEQNTSLIIGACNDQTIAARKCSELTAFGQSDWYLPSISELECLYDNRNVIGGFYTMSGIVYWSSTETNSNWSNAQNFNTGSTTTVNQKAGAARVRCVRRN